VPLDSEGNKVVHFGQNNIDDELHGVGRQIQISCLSFGAIWEGQYENGELTGFGRFFKISKNYGFEFYIGMMKEGEYHGYGRRITDTTDKEGQWEYGIFRENKSKHKFYNPEKDPLGRKIDFDYYNLDGAKMPGTMKN
jgi:hypothetical protein